MKTLQNERVFDNMFFAYINHAVVLGAHPCSRWQDQGLFLNFNHLISSENTMSLCFYFDQILKVVHDRRHQVR